MMPPMKPTGINTATIENVVASTAKPISWVPSNAASRGCLKRPFTFMPAWRTIFSRTTIASSISNPTHNDSAIKVIILMVKPNKSMNKNVPTNETGSVKPVMTVERHEFKNKNTISMVSKAPSINVRRTFSTPTRICRDPSLMTSIFTPGWRASKVGCNSLITFFKPSATSIVFCPCALMMSSAKVR